MRCGGVSCVSTEGSCGVVCLCLCEVNFGYVVTPSVAFDRRTATYDDSRADGRTTTKTKIKKQQQAKEEEQQQAKEEEQQQAKEEEQQRRAADEDKDEEEEKENVRSQYGQVFASVRFEHELADRQQHTWPARCRGAVQRAAAAAAPPAHTGPPWIPPQTERHPGSVGGARNVEQNVRQVPAGNEHHQLGHTDGGRGCDGAGAGVPAGREQREAVRLRADRPHVHCGGAAGAAPPLRLQLDGQGDAHTEYTQHPLENTHRPGGDVPRVHIHLLLCGVLSRTQIHQGYQLRAEGQIRLHLPVRLDGVAGRAVRQLPLLGHQVPGDVRQRLHGALQCLHVLYEARLCA